MLCSWRHRLLGTEALLLSASFLAEQISDGKGWSCFSSFYLVFLFEFPVREYYFSKWCVVVCLHHILGGGSLTCESFCVFYFLKAVLRVYSQIAKGHCNRASFKDRHFALSHHTVQIIFYKSDCCECIKCVCLSIAHDYCCYVVLMC